MKEVLKMRFLASVAAIGLVVLTMTARVGAQHQHGGYEGKAVAIQGEAVDLSCYLSHGARGQSHAKCAAICINKWLPIGILSKADAYQRLKKFAAKTVTVTGVVVSRNGITGVLVQKVEATSAAKP